MQKGVSRMKRFLLATAALSALAAPAMAADMAPAPVYKAPVPVPIAYGWTGWYAGANLGGAWSNDPVTVSTSNVAFCPAPACTAALLTSQISAQGASGSFGGNGAGVIGGGQIGYNLQISPAWVAGLETDFQGLSGSSNVTGGGGTIGLPGFPGSGVTTNGITVTNQLDWMGTVRARFGYLVSPNLLVYGTGGLAYGDAKSSTGVSQTLVAFAGVTPDYGSSASVSGARAGWTAGGGLEWMIFPRWSVKAEYLHYDLGSVTYNGTLAAANTVAPFGNYFVNNVASTTRFDGDIVRAGVNYHW
jgi:outer membrane immunogenic protein